MRNRNALPALDLLVGFEAAARHLSFTKAGEELFLTQSAVSRQIKELEEQLGVELFQRRHRALALTGAGKSFSASAAQVLTTMRAAPPGCVSVNPARRGMSHSAAKEFEVVTDSPFLPAWVRSCSVAARIVVSTWAADA